MLKRLWQGVGLQGVGPVVMGIAALLWNAVRPLDRQTRRRIKRDLRWLKDNQPTLRDARFYLRYADDHKYDRFAYEWNKTFPGRLRQTAVAATATHTTAQGLFAVMPGFTDTMAAVRTYVGFGGNNGKNDQWEWYLTPWHRRFGDAVVAFLDRRITRVTHPLWNMYRQMYTTERPWMTRLPFGSNIAGVTAGYAGMSLLLYLDTHEARYLRYYRKYLTRFLKSVRAAFDVIEGEEFMPNGIVRRFKVSVPMEGILYGLFFWQGALFLGLMQRQLGLYSLFDRDELSGLADYVEHSKVGDGYAALGDSEPFNGKCPNAQFYAIMLHHCSPAACRTISDHAAEIYSYYLTEKLK